MRLTEKIKENIYREKLFGVDTEDVIDKLGQLEDIEDELGINLVTLFIALRNGIYTVEDGYIPPDFLLLKYNKKFSRLVDNRPSAIAGGTCFYLQGYRTLWALTKEELTDEVQSGVREIH